MPTRGRRLHFNNEVDTQRRLLLASIASLSVRAFVVVCHRRHGVTEFAAREACLEVIVAEVQALGVARLVVESRQDDREDRRIITRVRQPEPLLVFEHRTARHEPMLGLADAITWAVGAGANWQAIVEPVLFDVIELRPQRAEPGSPTYGWATGSTSRSACRGQVPVCADGGAIARHLTRRTRLPNQRAGNRVHFHGCWPEALPACVGGDAIRKPVPTRMSPGFPQSASPSLAPPGLYFLQLKSPGAPAVCRVASRSVNAGPDAQNPVPLPSGRQPGPLPRALARGDRIMRSKGSSAQLRFVRADVVVLSLGVTGSGRGVTERARLSTRRRRPAPACATRSTGARRGSGQGGTER